MSYLGTALQPPLSTPVESSEILPLNPFPIFLRASQPRQLVTRRCCHLVFLLVGDLLPHTRYFVRYGTYLHATATYLQRADPRRSPILIPSHRPIPTLSYGHIFSWVWLRCRPSTTHPHRERPHKRGIRHDGSRDSGRHRCCHPQGKKRQKSRKLCWAMLCC